MKRRTRTLFAIGAVAVIGLIAVDHLGGMDRRFFGQSLPAARALVHYLAGDYAGAARLYRDALRRTAAGAPAAQAGSWTEFARGDLAQAEVLARRESGIVPTDPEPLLTLAEIALARRDSVTALAQAARVLELRRDDYDALLITAVAHARQGAPHAAIGALKRALRYDRVERRITVFLAALETTGELDDRSVNERPNCLLAHLHRYLRIYDPSQARPAARYSQRAIEVGDDADDAYVTLGVIHTKQGHPTRAVAAFRQALAVNPRNTAALLAAARFHENRGELDQAYGLTRAAFEADRDDRFVVAALHAFLVEKLGDYREALALAAAAVAVNSNDGEAWWRRGHVQTELGDHLAALQSYERAAELMPWTAELANNIGDTLAALDRDQEALVAYRHAIALDPFWPQPHLGLGVLYGKVRRWTEAIDELETVARLGGGLAVGLCELYWETGRRSAASVCATAVLTADPDNVQGLALIERVRGWRQSARSIR